MPEDFLDGIPDKMEEECGVFACYGVEQGEASHLAYLGLYALQHRGQESAGIAVSDGTSIRMHRGMGLAADVFDDTILGQLEGNASIGHVRYSTAGGSSIDNAQPLLLRCALGSISIAHNGNLVNTAELRESLIKSGALFQSTTDSEVIANLIARSRKENILDALKEACGQIRGAFSLVVLAQDKIVGIRDPFGFRPLCLGKYGDGYILASESCAIDSLGGDFIRDVLPGEMVMIGPEGVTSIQLWPATPKFCIFEYIYFARPDSTFDGMNVHEVRIKLGKELARASHVDADIVIPVPDSGISAALGYSEESGIPYGSGLIKNRYVGRTFIQPNQKEREKAVSIKLNPIVPAVAGKRVIMVDDSLVRGTTSRKIVLMLRKAGATEVHLRVSSPPVTHSCYFGIDTPERQHLIASENSVEEIREKIEADSLAYLSIEDMLRAVGVDSSKLCQACFTGNYPVSVSACVEGSCGRCGIFV